MGTFVVVFVLSMCTMASFFVGLTFRNSKVFKYRNDLSIRAHKLDMENILSGILEPKTRLSVVMSVPVEDMLREFWKPVDSFYTKEQLQYIFEPMHNQSD